MSFNGSSNQHFKSVATIVTISTIPLAIVTIILDLTVLICLFYCVKIRKRLSKNNSHRIGFLYSFNTYAHITGCTTVFLIMSIRTLYRDIKIHNKIDSPASWHCRLLNYFFGIFSAGIYGPTFLHALYRFWRITNPHKHSLLKFNFHLQLVIIYTISIIILSIPIWFRSAYMPSENYCTNKWSSVYNRLICVGIPVIGTIIVYFKIALYLKTNWQPRKRMKRIQRDVSTIRGMILFLSVVLVFGSIAAIARVWSITQKRVESLSYRLFYLFCQIALLACSVTFLVVSPQHIRALLGTYYKQQQQSSYRESVSNSNERPTPDTLELKYSIDNRVPAVSIKSPVEK